MKTQILTIPGKVSLSKKEQNNIKGGTGGGLPALSLCGCDCTGAVTGPKYCEDYISCPQVYTC